MTDCPRHAAAHMDLRQIRYFVGVVQAGSFTAAATRLHVAQPALSHQISKLEQSLGEQLLHRHSRGIGLTEAGERLYVHARQILDHLEQARIEVTHFKGPLKGPVRIGMPHSVDELIAIRVLLHARERYPEMKITVIDHMSEELNVQLCDGELDLCLTYIAPEPDWVECVPLFSESLCLAVPAGLAGKIPRQSSISLSRAAAYPLVLPTHSHGLRRMVEDAASKLGISLNVRFEVDSFQLLQHVLEEELACAVLPISGLLHARQNPDLRIFVIKKPTMQRVLHLARSARKPLTRSVHAVREILFTAMREQISKARRFPGTYSLDKTMKPSDLG